MTADDVTRGPKRSAGSTWSQWREAALGHAFSRRSTDARSEADDAGPEDVVADRPETPETGDDEFAVRLAWPDDAGADEPGPEPVPPAFGRGDHDDADRDEDEAEANSGVEGDERRVGDEAVPGGRRATTTTAELSDEDERAALEGVPAVPLLPAMAGRLETMQNGIMALAMRVDALSAASNSMRSAINDRVDACVDTVGRTSRSHAAALDEHRRATDRALTDLTQSLVDVDEALRRLVSRMDELVDDVRATSSATAGMTLDDISSAVAARVAGLPVAEVDVETVADAVSSRVIGQLPPPPPPPEAMDPAALTRDIAERVVADAPPPLNVEDLARVVADRVVAHVDPLVGELAESQSARPGLDVDDLGRVVAERVATHVDPLVTELVASQPDASALDVESLAQAVASRVATHVDPLVTELAESQSARPEPLDAGEVAGAVAHLVAEHLDPALAALAELQPAASGGVQVDADEVARRVSEAVAEELNAERGRAARPSPEVIDLLGAVADDLGQVRDLTSAVLDGLPASAPSSAVDLAPVIGRVERQVKTLSNDLQENAAEVLNELRHLRPRLARQAPAVDDETLERLADLVVSRLERSFEVVETHPRSAPEPEPSADTHDAATEDESPAGPRRRRSGRRKS